jgi:hypothetical protein
MLLKIGYNPRATTQTIASHKSTISQYLSVTLVGESIDPGKTI